MALLRVLPPRIITPPQDSEWKELQRKSPSQAPTPECLSPTDDEPEWGVIVDPATAESTWVKCEHEDGHDGDVKDDCVHIPNDKNIPAVHTRTQVLPTPLDRAYVRTARGINTTLTLAKNAPGFVEDAVTSGIEGGFRQLEQTRESDISVFTPANVLMATVVGAGANVTESIAREARGTKDARVARIVTQARNHLENGRGQWTAAQEKTIGAWIKKAEKDLQDFANNDYVGVGENAKDDSTEAKPGITLGDRWRKTREAVERSNPTKKLLKAKAPQLFCLIGALEEFCSIPHAVRPLDENAFLTRLNEMENEGDFIAAKSYKASLIEVGLDAVKNARAEADQQVKYLPKILEGPGTGKSSGAEAMMKALGQAYVQISGETIKSWKVPKEQAKKAAAAAAEAAAAAAKASEKEDKDGKNSSPAPEPEKREQKDIYDLLMDEIKAQLRDLDSTNVIIWLDDIHVTWDANPVLDSEGNSFIPGPFARDPLAFNKLMDVFKTVTDAKQNFVPDSEVELSPLPGVLSLKFPLNFKRVQFYLTGNTTHPSLRPNPTKSGGEWLTSRLKSMGVAYMTEADRLRTAKEGWRGRINKAIARHYGWWVSESTPPKADLARVEREIDQDLAKECLEKIARLDSDVASSKYGGQTGHRGLIFFLLSYEAYILRQLQEAGTKVRRDIYSMQAEPAYNLEAAMAGIEDYNKAKNKEFEEQKEQDEINKNLQRLRGRTAGLEGSHREAFTSELAKAESGTTIIEKKLAVKAADFLLSWYGDRVAPPDEEELTARIMEDFSDLKAADTSDDVDTYRPLQNFIISDLLTRKMMTDDGLYTKSKNKIVRVRTTDPSAFDQGFFEKLGASLGGIPVHFLDSDSFLSQPVPLPHLNQDNIAKDPKQEELYKSIRDDIEGYCHALVHNNSRFSAEIYEHKVGKRSYFYSKLQLRRGDPMYFIFNTTSIKEILKGKDIVPNANLCKIIKSSKEFAEVVEEYEQPRVTFPDDYIKKMLKVPSAGEPYLVAVLTSDAQLRITDWASGRNNNVALEPAAAMQKFEEHIFHEILNQERIIANGQEIDPRAMRLFLVDGPDNESNPVANNDSSVATTITLTPPTLEGRSARADTAIKRTLVEVIRQAYWKMDDNDPNLPAPALRANEIEARNELVKFDKEQASNVRDNLNQVLTPGLLEKAAVQLAKYIGMRYSRDGLRNRGRYIERSDGNDSVKGYEGLPSLESLKKEWAAAYTEEISRIEAAIAAAKAEAERKAREAEEAAARKARAKAYKGGYGGGVYGGGDFEGWGDVAAAFEDNAPGKSGGGTPKAQAPSPEPAAPAAAAAPAGDEASKAAADKT